MEWQVVFFPGRADLLCTAALPSGCEWPGLQLHRPSPGPQHPLPASGLPAVPLQPKSDARRNRVHPSKLLSGKPNGSREVTWRRAGGRLWNEEQLIDGDWWLHLCCWCLLLHCFSPGQNAARPVCVRVCVFDWACSFYSDVFAFSSEGKMCALCFFH